MATEHRSPRRAVPALRRPERRELAALPRRVPFTLTVLALMLVLGVLTRALWQPVDASEWWDRLAYGLPALREGRWWTPVTGSLLATVPAQYLPVGLGFGLLVGWTELRLGTRRTALVTVAGQLVGVLGAALLLALASATPWPWAQETAAALDVGFSAGAVCAVTVGAATLAPPWRGRLTFAVLGYAVANLLAVGVLWDLEHAVAVVLALVLARHVARGRPAPPPLVGEAARRERRYLAGAVLALVAVTQVLAALLPGSGPLGESGEPVPGLQLAAVVALQVGGAALLGLGVRWSWPLGLAVAVAGAAWTAVHDPPPRAVAGVLAYAGVAALLLLTRTAWPRRQPR